MSTKTLLSAVAAAALLMGCTHLAFLKKPPPIGTETLRCGGAGPPCVIKVDVSCFLLLCQASVDHQLIVVTRGNANVPIRWELQNPNYKFAANGIEFLDDKEGEFKCGSLGSGDQRFQCVDRNTKSATLFKYNVNVVGVRTLDPWVMNE